MLPGTHLQGKESQYLHRIRVGRCKTNMIRWYMTGSDLYMPRRRPTKYEPLSGVRWQSDNLRDFSNCPQLWRESAYFVMCCSGIVKTSVFVLITRHGAVKNEKQNKNSHYLAILRSKLTATLSLLYHRASCKAWG